MNHSFEKKFPNFNAELDLNDRYLSTAIERLGSLLSSDLGLSSLDIKDYASGSIRYDLGRAITYDILRYASFHDISPVVGAVYDVDESVRASYFLKWILQLRPLSLEREYSKMAGDDAPPPPLKISDVKNEFMAKLSDDQLNQAYALYYSNEYLAIYAATIIIGLLDKNGNPKPILEFYKERHGVHKLIYALRYRLKHQDTYQPFLGRIKTLAGMIPQI